MIDIIIVNYNTTDLLLKSLASIYETLKGISANIYIESNGPKDGIEHVKQIYPKVIVNTNKKNLGFSRAVNQAIKKSAAPFILLLNPDTIIKDGFFEPILNFIQQNHYVGVVGPKILNPDLSVQGSARSFPTFLTALFGRSSFLSRVFPNNRFTRGNIVTTSINGKTAMDVDWVSGACMLVRRKAIDDIGLMDEQFFMYWEDADWCRRMRHKGWKVVYAVEDRTPRVYPWMNEHFQPFTRRFFFQCEWLVGQRPKQ